MKEVNKRKKSIQLYIYILWDFFVSIVSSYIMNATSYTKYIIKTIFFNYLVQNNDIMIRIENAYFNPAALVHLQQKSKPYIIFERI